jgi:two-component system nitrate/nitrite response regulator NarL
MAIRILLADDHPIIVAGVEALLRGSDYELAHHVRNGDDVLAAVKTIDPDIVILDERMPGKTGLDVFSEIRRTGDERPIILLTGSIGDQRALDAMDAGINGIVLKHTASDQLLQCLDEVRQGGRWIDQSLLQRALDRARGRKEKLGLFDQLTAREREIVTLVAENLRNQEIAARLDISEGTVKVHLHNIYNRLGLSNRLDLVLLIRDSGLSAD